MNQQSGTSKPSVTKNTTPKKQRPQYSNIQPNQQNNHKNANYLSANQQIHSPLTTPKSNSISKFRRTNPNINTSKLVSPTKGKPPLPQNRSAYENLNSNTNIKNIRDNNVHININNVYKTPLSKQQMVQQQKTSQYLSPLTVSRESINKVSQTPKSLKSKYLTTNTQRYFSNQTPQQNNHYSHISVTDRNTPSKNQRMNINFDSKDKSNKKYSKQKQKQIEDIKSLRSFKSSEKGTIFTSNCGNNTKNYINDTIRKENQSYHLYWKRKAHEYLQMNFKLSQQIGMLKRQIEQYQYGGRMQNSQVANENIASSNYNSQRSNTVQNNTPQSSYIYSSSNEKFVPLHLVQLQQKQYLQTISQLEHAIRSKDQLILKLQSKIIEQNNQIKGQHQKIDLLQKLRNQIEQLQYRNQYLDKENKKVIQMNKVYETQKVLYQAKQMQKPRISIKELSPEKYDKYTYQMYNHKKQRYRSLE